MVARRAIWSVPLPKTSEALIEVAMIGEPGTGNGGRHWAAGSRKRPRCSGRLWLPLNEAGHEQPEAQALLFLQVAEQGVDIKPGAVR